MNNLREIKYPEFWEAYLTCSKNVWHVDEVNMASDVADWNFNATDAERNLIGGILKSFTQAELSVGCYWRDIVAKKFSEPEIVFMATTFSFFETLHARAYDHLEATLGLDTFDAFMADPIAQQKIGTLFDNLHAENSLGTSLALFSAGVEGISLNASFALLLAFSRRGMFKGLQQIISWSAMDECAHSLMGIKLSLIAGDINEQKVYNGIDVIVQNELAFVRNAFASANTQVIDGIASLIEVEDLIYRQANKKLKELNLTSQYVLLLKSNPLYDYFNATLTGQNFHDFFSHQKNGTGYTSTASQDFNSIDPTQFNIFAD